MPRIITGKFGGRVIDSPPKQDLRPMMSKVRAALFDMLEHFDALYGDVLDLYAGSGAVGIEALSRGMEMAHFVEWNPVSVNTIQQNLNKLGLNRQGYVHRRKVEDVIAKPSLLHHNKPFGLVSVTPPYLEVDYSVLAQQLAESELIGPGSVIFFEHPRRATLADEIGPLLRLRHRKYGRTHLSIYEYSVENGEW